MNFGGGVDTKVVNPRAAWRLGPRPPRPSCASVWLELWVWADYESGLGFRVSGLGFRV